MTITLFVVSLTLIQVLTTAPVKVSVAWWPWVGWSAAALLSGAAAMNELPRYWRRVSSAALDLDQAAKRVAKRIGEQWRREESQRREQDPLLLPVRWDPAPEKLIDHWADIRRTPLRTTPDSLIQAGQTGGILDIYRQLSSGRLVVLGKPGSGKTVLARRFVLDLLNNLSGADPIPVIFSLGSWNPTDTLLRDWLAEQLVTDDPALAEPDPNGKTSLAVALIETRRVLPILDGFDEIAKRLHRAALHALNATTMPLVLTSRNKDYENAVASRTDVLKGAAGIELKKVTVDDLADYLPRSTSKTTTVGSAGISSAWDPVIERLRDDPNSTAAKNLRDALSTPLMVGLARANYSDGDKNPADLLNVSSFPDSKAVEEHLLDDFIPAIYRNPSAQDGNKSRRRWSSEDAEHWFGKMAVDLDRTGGDLKWWSLRDTVPLLARVLIGGAIAGLGAVVLLWLAWPIGAGLGIGYGVGVTLPRKGRQPVRTLLRVRRHLGRIAWIMAGGITGGFLGGLVGGILGSQASETGGLALGLIEGLDKGAALNSIAGITVGLVVGFILAFVGRFGAPGVGTEGQSGVVNWMQHVPRCLLLGFVNGILGGLVLGTTGGLAVGLASGLSFGLIMGLETAIDVESAATPLDVLRTDRNNAILTVVLFALTIGLPVGLASQPILGLPNALALGFGTGLTFGLGMGLGFSAWGQWLLISRLWLPLTGRSPRALFAFLEDAHRLGVLRQNGSVYQFRHDLLLKRLAMRETHKQRLRRPASREMAPHQTRRPA